MVSPPSCFQQHRKLYSSPFVSLCSQSATTDPNPHHSPQYLLLFISLSALLLFIVVFDFVGGGVISDTGTSPGIRSLRTQAIPPKNIGGVASAQNFSLESVYKAVVTSRSFSWGGTSLLSQMAEKLLWLLLKWLIAFSHCRFASVGKKLP